MILPKDAENIFADMRVTSYTAADANKRVRDVLQDLCEEPSNVANMYRGDHKKKTCITFQTHHMRRMYRRFPEMLCVDATYGTNTNKYV